jgi:O-antigen biosynthesis protein
MGSTETARESVAASGTAKGEPRRIYVVAGMHRAGTSVVARALQALGIDLGDRLMSADQRMNARGFFEDIDVVRIDDALLEDLGADWKNLALLADTDWRSPALAAARTDARRLLESRLARSGQYGFKDPRVSRLLPLWQGLFAELGASDAYVVAVRHPLSVIASLTARDGLDVRRSAWLWLTHLACALHHTAGRPRVVVDYDRLLAAPRQELARIAVGLHLPASALAGKDIPAYTDTFLSTELRHAQHSPEHFDAATLPPLVGEAHALGQRLARAEVDSTAEDAEVSALFGRVAAFSPLLAYSGAVERAADEVPRLEGELDWAKTSFAKATEFNASLKEALRQKDDALATAQVYNDELRATMERKDADFREALEHKDAYNEDLRAAVERKEAELVVAHAKLESIGQRVLGRIVLGQMERKQ